MFEPNRNRTPMTPTDEREVAPTQPRYAYVLSDVHIGNNTPTCWYQRSVHEGRLTEVLSWIVARRASVREVVLLGDLFDVWTYPPSVQPPSMGDIIAANPTLLGRSGPFAALVRAFPGQVRLLLGNHDSSLTRADIETLNRSLGGNLSRGERIELVQAPWRVVTGASGKRTVFTHGHHWCMFNAPDARSRWGTIPVGHFVTRAIGYQLSRTPGGTAADRPNSGNPSGLDALALLAGWNRRDDLAALLLTYICRHTGMSLTEPIVMPGGRTTTVREAMRVYAGLFTRWVAQEGRPEDALRAAAADYRGVDLAWFAQRLALRTASDLTIMGHTHAPVGGLRVSPVNYVNSGYECPARPDVPPKEFTFTQVDLEGAAATVLAVSGSGGGFTVAPARAPAMQSVILGRFMDFSCYARIENRSNRALRLVRASKDAASHWVVPPPLEIAPRSRANIWVQDTLGARGSAGRFAYSDGSRTYEFVVECPTGVLPNVVRSPIPYRTRTGKTSAWRNGGVDRTGHPVQVEFLFGAPHPAGTPVPALPAAPAVPAAPARPVTRRRSHETPSVVAARAILARAGTPRERGVVLCVAHLSSNDGRPLLDPTTEPSRSSPSGVQLKNPPNHLVGRDVQTIALPDGTAYRFVWIQPNVPPTSPPLTGGMAFLPAPGAPTFTLVTFNVAGLDNDHRRRCTNGHHAEMQLVGFVNAQPVPWRMRLGRLELHNYSRTGPTWGYSACNACLHDLASFLTALNSLTRRDKVRASISWERLYDKNAACGHPTDAANIRRLVSAGWDEPMGPRPPGTQWPVAPGPSRAPARPRVLTP
jgi:predicted phosphodiesterase